MYLRVRDRVSDEDVISAALCGILMRTVGGGVGKTAVASFFRGGYREMKRRLYTGLLSNSICGN